MIKFILSHLFMPGRVVTALIIYPAYTRKQTNQTVQCSQKIQIKLIHKVSKELETSIGHSHVRNPEHQNHPTALLMVLSQSWDGVYILCSLCSRVNRAKDKETQRR